MPNEMKYGNVDWPGGSPIEGERLATNGEYTGHHKGKPLQDSLEGADNEPYLRPRETVRYGTMTPDAKDENFPDKLVQVSYSATGDITEISLPGVTYDKNAKVFQDVPSKTESFTFKDGEQKKKASNAKGVWSVNDEEG